MAERIQRKVDRPSDEAVTEESMSSGTSSQKIKDDIDSLLDEIDEVLESNAEEFVKNYVQKGGE